MKDLISSIKNPIADCHCDLLCYLAHDPLRTAYDLAPRCGIPQLRQGNVKLQVMAIFTETQINSIVEGLAQVEVFKNLPQRYSDAFRIIQDAETLQTIEHSSQIGILPAIENASSICDEKEELVHALKRLDTIQKEMGKIVYITLTWNTENRFGGGALTQVGLKDDGRRLIDYLSAQGIPLDLSHASDYLAHDVFHYVDQNKLPLTIMASHSNFRQISEVPRNLPDEIAKEILKREGIIGLSFVRPFIGEDSIDNFTKQLEHALSFKESKGLCFGADFFFGEDVSPQHRKPPERLFFPGIDHAGTYEVVLNLWKEILTEELNGNICFKNLQTFLLKNIYNKI